MSEIKSQQAGLHSEAGAIPDESLWQSRLLSSRTDGMKANMIREILKVVAQPGMISLAGGLPAPESFPIKIMEELASDVLKEYSWRSLQYGPTEGFGPLREALAALVAKRGVKATSDDVIITSGSQGSLDALGRILISPGDYVAVEAPTYLGAITAFNAYEPRYVEIETDDGGVIPESLEHLLKNTKCKMIYSIPTFQNPSGRTISLARRQQIAEIIIRRQALLVEDDAYGFVRYRGDDLPPIKVFAPDNVVYLSTLSKTLAPGLRIGYCVAPPVIKRWMVLSKQGVDLHTSSFDQAMAAKYISGGYLERQLPHILNLYRPRLDAMLAALDKYFPKDFKWSKPNGGMFVWAEGPSGFNTDLLYEKAIERKVAFVPGRHFFVTPDKGLETMRLNFSMVNEATITKAIEMLAEIIKTSPR